MIDDYLNQSLTWQAKGAVNDYNEPTYTTSTIKGRKEPGFKLVRNAQGEEVISSGFVVTKSVVQVGDLIDGLMVISSEPLTGLDGAVEHYEVYLK